MAPQFELVAKKKEREKFSRNSDSNPSTFYKQIDKTTKYPNASLLGLPIELRSQIFHEVWRWKGSFYLIYDRLRFTVIYETQNCRYCSCAACSKSTRTPGSRIKKLPWFFVSKQVLVEAIEQFYLGNLSLWIYDHYFDGRKLPTHPSEWLSLSSWRARMVTFGYVGIEDDSGFQEGQAKHLKYDSDPFKHLKPELITNPTLRRLKNVFVPRILFVKDRDQSLVIDFGPLERLRIPSLKEVDIKIKVPANYEECVGVVDLGMGMIGEGATCRAMSKENLWSDMKWLFVERDWPEPPPWWYYRFERK